MTYFPGAKAPAWASIAGVPGPLLSTTAAFTTAQESKLAGIATGATANSSDAFLLSRANHTGTQAAGTITGLATVATSGSAADLTGNLAVARLNGGTGASGSTFWRGDGTWAAPAGGGTVTSVSGTGTVAGLTLTGTVTGSGSLTLGGSLSTTSAAISDFNSATRAQVEAELIAGAGITITPSGSGASRQLTVAASGGGGSDPWTYAKLASDQATTSNIWTALTGMTFTPAANTDYEVEWCLMVSTATTTVGPRPQASWGSGYQYGGVDMYTVTSNTAEGQRHDSITTTAGSSVAAVGGLPLANRVYTMRGYSTFRSGATPTAFALSLASETAGTAVTAKAGSFLKYRTI